MIWILTNNDGPTGFEGVAGEARWTCADGSVLLDATLGLRHADVRTRVDALLIDA